MRVVAFVALHRRGTTRAQVAGALWQGSSEEHAAGNLRGVLWSLRKQGVPVLDVDDGLVHLSPEVSVDIQDMTRAAAEVLDTTGVDPSIGLGVFAEDLPPEWDDEWLTTARRACGS